MTSTDGGRGAAWIDRGLVLVLLAALAAALTWRTQRISPDAPRLTLRPQPLAAGVRFGALDALEQDGTAANLGAQPVAVNPHGELHLKGWAVDPATGIPPSRVFAQIDGGAEASAAPDTWRPDVAAALNDPLAPLSGFRISLPAAAAGRHRLSVWIESRGRRLAAVSPVELDVAP